jgi:predicted RecA/RadA family phage recombinase
VARNHVTHGDQIAFIAGADVASGAGVVIGTLLGVNLHAVASGASGIAAIEGAFSLPKAAGFAVANGDRLIWSVSDAQFIDVADVVEGDLIKSAVAIAAAASDDETVTARLTPDSTGALQPAPPPGP